MFDATAAAANEMAAMLELTKCEVDCECGEGE